MSTPSDRNAHLTDMTQAAPAAGAAGAAGAEASIAFPGPHRNYVGGEFVDAADVMEVRNPATGAVIAHVPAASAEETAAAVAAAKAAQPDWAALPNIERAAYLRRIAALLRERAGDFAEMLVVEQGKTRGLAEVEANFTADYLDYMAEWARRIEGEVIPSDRPGEMILLTHRPLGVVGGILPWNFPFFLIARKMAPALLTGNTIVINPSSETPVNALEFARLVDEAGVPAGVFNLVSGRGRVVGETLSTHPDVAMISMTGSVDVGKRIMEKAASTLTRVNLELGGKAPAIVLASADLDLAAKAIWDSRVINTGQVCNCAEVVLVEESVHDELVAKLKELFDGTRYGDPSDIDELDMGPLISETALDDIAAMVSRACDAGATLVTGGSRAEDKGAGWFFEPTILDDVTPEMEIAKEEIFGPLLPIVRVADLDEALAIANASRFGLTSSVFTEDLNLALKAVEGLQYGETYVNREHFEAMQGFHAGRRESGIGGADGKHGLMEFTETHVAYIQRR